MKKLAIVAGGWHFPLHFYERIAAQKIPDGWEVEMHCVSHRNPEHSRKEKQEELSGLGWSHRETIDRVLYHDFATIEKIEALGWKYKEYPNTIGDWGMSNQWLDENDYKKYDMFLFTHDDNFILSDAMLLDVLQQEDWLILSNSTGNSQRRLRRWAGLPKPLHFRGSFEFFRREMMEKMGGKFDLSETTLTREGTVETPNTFTALSNWGTTVFPLEKLIHREHLESRIHTLSPYYRMSKYCLEGERGFVHSTNASNTAEENRGLRAVVEYYTSHT